MENLKVEISVKDLNDILKEHLSALIKKSFASNRLQVESQIEKFFSKAIFSDKESKFENALDWAIESIFRVSLEQAMQELDFNNLVKNKIKEIISNSDYIQNLAEEKIKKSLGL